MPLHTSTFNSSPRHPATPLSLAAMQNPFRIAPGDVMREVALKAILEKKLKGDEETVWSEMQVVQDLNRPSPNVVRYISPSPFSS
jgi:hypothetical protein